MPQSNHKTLIRVLLWWVTLLSVCQAALLVLFFTMGHFGKSQNTEAPKDTVYTDNRSGQKSPPEDRISQDKAKMFTFKATGVHSENKTVIWYGVNPNYTQINGQKSGDLTVQKDGNFFVCLRITLKNIPCRNQDRCPQIEVILLSEGKKTVVLTGWINNTTLSTGLLCKMEKLLKDDKLRVEFKDPDPVTVKINQNQSHSSLDFIYMPN